MRKYSRKVGGTSLGGGGLNSREHFLQSVQEFSDQLKKDPSKALGAETGDALDALEKRRVRFLRCSGMHGNELYHVVKQICAGEYKSPSIAYVAPALYEGIPEFLNKVVDSLGELAVYSSLYMGLISVAGFTGFYPAARVVHAVTAFYNGVFASMFCHSAVVMLATGFRVAAIGQLRDSDKLLYLWRARFMPIITACLFLFGTFSAIYAVR